MSNFIKQVPCIIDLQPEPQEVIIRLPEWMKYLFVMFYLGSIIGLGFLFDESLKVFKLYQEMVQARRTTENTVKQINALQSKLVENKNIQKEYDQYKLRQKQILRPGPLLEWVPSVVAKTQKAHTITIQQAGEFASVRVALEKPISDTINRNNKAPAEYLTQSYAEETPKFVELPQGQKPNLNNEFTVIAIQLKKQ